MCGCYHSHWHFASHLECPTEQIMQIEMFSPIFKPVCLKPLGSSAVLNGLKVKVLVNMFKSIVDIPSSDTKHSGRYHHVGTTSS